LGGNRRRPYAIKIAYEDRPGLWKQRYLSYHESAKEAQQALERYNLEQVHPNTAPVTLQEIYDLWAGRKYARAGKASVASYKASWIRLSLLASKPMDRITIDDLQQIIDKDEVNGLSKSSINNDKILMRALFKFAMERDIIVKDYSAFIEMPSVEAKHEKNAFTEAQVKQLEMMAAEGSPWADTVLMLCYTGFRITEFLQLTPFSYDGKADCLRGGIKTEAGKNRVVPVHPKIKPCLLAWLDKKGATIICDGHGKPITDKWYRNNVFPAIAQALGVPNATPHWCRHTFASMLHAAQADDLAIKRILGHANSDVTEHYTHTDITFLRRELLKLA